MAGDFDYFGDESASEAATAKIGMDMDADAADVAFPAAELLVESADTEDLIITKGEQGKVTTEIDIRAPVMDNGALGDAMLDEEKLAGRDGVEEVEQAVLIVSFEGAEIGAEVGIESGGFGEFIEEEVERHKGSWFMGLADGARFLRGGQWEIHRRM